MSHFDRLADSLIAAQNDSSLIVRASDFCELTLDQAQSIQNSVRDRLGYATPAAKVGLAKDGSPLAAPIYEPVYKASGEALTLPKRGVLGIEIEVAVRLNRDLTADLATADDAALLEAIDDFVLVIEPLATRFDDRTQAGLWGQFADNLVTAGLVHASERPLPRQHLVDGLPMSITANGETIYEEPTRHPFGDVLSPLRAYAGVSRPGAFVLKAGTLVTTGSLCKAIVPVKSAAMIRAQLGADHWVSIELVA